MTGNEHREDLAFLQEPRQADPLHGVPLQLVVERLAAFYGWADLGQRVRIRCFQDNPSVGSSLKFLRRTPWAREKVEELYLYMLRKHQHG